MHVNHARGETRTSVFRREHLVITRRQGWWWGKDKRGTFGPEKRDWWRSHRAKAREALRHDQEMPRNPRGEIGYDRG